MSKKKNNTKKILWIIFAIVLIASLVAENWMHPHAKFGLEATPLFNAWFGFVSCSVIVLVSKLLGVILKRKEGYYKEAPNDR